EFALVLSYNPGYQSVLKDLKPSTRQRFVAIEFRYPEPAVEETIIRNESGADHATASALVRLAHMTRNLKGNGLDEGASTRLLVHAARLIARGIAPATACHGAVAEALSDDPEMLRTLDEFAASVF
ncbi:MAG: AAA family ATPase, partial [Betaproteobacteria bacterium]|nr:AAA family ATPase [Betaproteobacteria bacterium]